MVLGVDELQMIAESIKVFSDQLRHNSPEHPLLTLAESVIDMANRPNGFIDEYLKGYSEDTKIKVQVIHQNYLLAMVTQLKMATRRTASPAGAVSTPSLGFSCEGTGEAPE